MSATRTSNPDPARPPVAGRLAAVALALVVAVVMTAVVISINVP